MIARTTRIQLVVLTVLSLVAMGTLVLHYANIPAALGYNRMTVSAQFTDGGLLYPNANVTYRGVTIGKVTDVAIEPDGHVKVTMSIQADAHIPAAAPAAIHSVSAIGEQYVDLTGTGGGPYLVDGAQIPVSRTSLPVEIGPVLESADNLLSSLPRQSLQTDIDEFYKGFNNTGPALGRLLDGADALAKEANASYPQTHQLIQEARPVLDTQVAASANINSWAHDLDKFTNQLRASDPALRGSLDHIPGGARQVRKLFDDLHPTLPILLANLTTINQVLEIYNPTAEQALVLAPRIYAGEQAMTDPRYGGAASLDLKLNIDNPQTCQTGYAPVGSPQGPRGPDSISDIGTKPRSFCQLAQNDQHVVRGMRNLPCLEGPKGKRAPTPWECRGDAYRSAGNENPDYAVGGGLANLPTGTYDPSTGVGQGPDGQLLALGGAGNATRTGKERTWQSLLLDPVGK